LKQSVRITRAQNSIKKHNGPSRMDAFEIIAERKIREAIDRGEFDNLPCKGMPPFPDRLDNLPPDMRMA
jgi:hypothetical protein